MGSLKNDIEAILFISPRPMTIRRLASLLEVEENVVAEALSVLLQEYTTKEGGITIAEHSLEVQMITTASAAPAVQKFIKDEATGELTKPSLETLTIIAYRGPITRSDLEKIRGVNCSIILRNLMMRGLIDSQEDKKRLVTFYAISMDFLKFLGLPKISDLPEYQSLHGVEVIQQILKQDELPNT